MKLTLIGHDDRYAIEQSLLAFFPEERPAYEGDEANYAVSRLTSAQIYTTATTTIVFQEKTPAGSAQWRNGHRDRSVSVS